MPNRRLKDYKNLHNGEACIVCGLGMSLYRLPKKWEKKYPIIGVNDINKNLVPNYQILSEPLTNERDEFKEKIKCIKETRCKTIFSAHPIDFKYSEPIIVEMIDLRNNDNIQEILDNNQLFAIRKITTVAISLAIYMGFKWIGVIGFDMKGERAVYPDTNSLISNKTALLLMNNYLRIVNKYCNDNGIKIYNLSNDSEIDAFPFAKFDDFNI